MASQQLFEPRRTQLDIRTSKLFIMGNKKIRVDVDVYNVTNISSVFFENFSYGPQWRAPVGSSSWGTVRGWPAGRVQRAIQFLRCQMGHRFLTAVGAAVAVVAIASITRVPVAGQAPGAARSSPAQKWTAPRADDGHPDLQGTWNAATITPLERPDALAGKATLNEAEAAAYAKEFLESASLDRRDGGPERDRSRAYPDYFTDRGTQLARVDNTIRTSLIVDPPDGHVPPLTAEGTKRVNADQALRAPSSDAGEQAGLTGQGIYDDPELRPLAERCRLSFGSSSGPPMLPVLYNNLKQIVQTRDTVMILIEMVHDARIIRIGGEHVPQNIRKWMGDSVGHWEGETLVVDTTNFTDKTRFRGSSNKLRVTERFTRVDPNTILYRFTIDDPATFTRPWTGEYPLVAVAPQEHIYEYACHEANYALEGILRGARAEEKAAAEAAQKGVR